MSEVTTDGDAGNGGHDLWDFAGWGNARRIADLRVTGRPEAKPAHKLGTWAATAICGNDITSSCLYVSALCAVYAGPYAPIVLLMVAAVLFLYRKVYAEVGSALPLNGGTYTVLLNTTNKKLAAMAACLTLLSYVATAVISAGEAMHYAHNLFGGLNVFSATIILLALFAFLNVIGISESSVVALAIFLFHIFTLTVLSVVAATVIARDPAQLVENWHLPPMDGLGHALFFGFAAAMLGISGFESSANFIEEQRAGVFSKTLRNMWIAVAIFNPLISFLSLGLIPLGEMRSEDLLAQMGARAWGPFFQSWISVDAVLVLSGAVLTSYVGVTGLMRRMALDRCLPQGLLRTNRLRGTSHWIILAFFLICCSILVVTGGLVETLAGVYTISFLSVMALFALGNMLLKVKRARLPRAERASWGAVSLALVAVLLGLLGNLLLKPEYVRVFGTYFAITITVVAIMFLRVPLLRLLLAISNSVADWVLGTARQIHLRVVGKIQEINARSVVYFAKGDGAAELNRAALYVLRNEQTDRMTVVHVYDDHHTVPPHLAELLSQIDHLYPQLRIDFLAVKGEFGPPLINALAERLGVPHNYMFIGTPGDRFPHRIEKLGGVRLIL